VYDLKQFRIWMSYVLRVCLPLSVAPSILIQYMFLTLSRLPCYAFLTSILQNLRKMKSFQLIVIALIVAFASAFAPSHNNKAVAFKPLAAAKAPESMKEIRDNKNAAAVAAFATALAPFAAHATDVDEATIIGYGAGLVACVVSLAVGFAIGYGTLVKL
jgi:hypothetical protein